ncbi:MAG TPA: PAS domain S-box protein [Candidatus Goldiibacteriota bacterium]|nr:PAS domain S-box protein [Candidatus Goldiibacteriota bacterium]
MPDKTTERRLLEEIKNLKEKLASQESLEKEVKSLKQSLRHAEELNSKMAMASLDAVMTLDLSGNIIYASERAAELYGAKSVSELMGKNVRVALSGEELHRLK